MLGERSAAAYTCADDVGGSGLASCVGTVPSGSFIDTSSVGPKTFTVAATDRAGNSASRTLTYTVVYRYSDVLQPVNADGSSVFRRPSTVPVKFRLTDANGNAVAGARATAWVARVSNEVVGSDEEATSTSAATTGNEFRWDASGSQYIFNLATRELEVGTYVLIVRLDDGTRHQVAFSLR